MNCLNNLGICLQYEEKGQLGVLLTPAQRRWMSTFRKMAKTKPIRMVSRPTNKFMKFCYDMSENQKFEVVITIIILLNMVQMSMEHDSASKEFEDAMARAHLSSRASLSRQITLVCVVVMSSAVGRPR